MRWHVIRLWVIDYKMLRRKLISIQNVSNESFILTFCQMSGILSMYRLLSKLVEVKDV